MSTQNLIFNHSCTFAVNLKSHSFFVPLVYKHPWWWIIVRKDCWVHFMLELVLLNRNSIPSFQAVSCSICGRHVAVARYRMFCFVLTWHVMKWRQNRLHSYRVDRNLIKICYLKGPNNQRHSKWIHFRIKCSSCTNAHNKVLIKNVHKFKIHSIANINFLVWGMTIIVQPKGYDGI